MWRPPRVEYKEARSLSLLMAGLGRSCLKNIKPDTIIITFINEDTTIITFIKEDTIIITLIN